MVGKYLYFIINVSLGFLLFLIIVPRVQAQSLGVVVATVKVKPPTSTIDQQNDTYIQQCISSKEIVNFEGSEVIEDPIKWVDIRDKDITGVIVVGSHYYMNDP